MAKTTRHPPISLHQICWANLEPHWLQQKSTLHKKSGATLSIKCHGRQEHLGLSLKSHLAALGLGPGVNQKGMESNEGRRFCWLHCGSCQVGPMWQMNGSNMFKHCKPYLLVISMHTLAVWYLVTVWIAPCIYGRKHHFKHRRKCRQLQAGRFQCECRSTAALWLPHIATTQRKVSWIDQSPSPSISTGPVLMTQGIWWSRMIQGTVFCQHLLFRCLRKQGYSRSKLLTSKIGGRS